MIKPHVYFDPDLQAYKVGMETEKHLYIFLITKAWQSNVFMIL